MSAGADNPIVRKRQVGMDKARYAYTQIFVDGEWRAPEGGESIEVTSPVTGASLGSVPRGSGADIDAAVRAAARAQGAWAALDGQARAEYLLRVAQRLEERQDELARLIAQEVGMPLKLAARIQVGLPVASWKNYAAHARELPRSEWIGNSLVSWEPAGVVGCITPWNYPLHQVTAKVGAALAAGCTVVLKPSELAPLSAFVLAEIARESGLPAGVFNVVCGYGTEAGEPLVGHALVDMVSFTGSTAAGSRVAEMAGRSVKRTALELGGKSASVVLPGADFARAVKSTIAGCFLNSGQTCTAPTRMLVPEADYDAVRALAEDAIAGYVTGDPLDPATRLGPVISERQRQRIQSFVDGARADGADIISGSLPAGSTSGYFVAPTVIGKVSPSSEVAQQEIFGPVLVVLTYRDQEEALAIANGTQYGLAGMVWGANHGAALSFARRIRAGQVDINGAPFNLDAPFGGFGRSGYGRENGRLGVEEFLVPKAYQLPADFERSGVAI